MSKKSKILMIILFIVIASTSTIPFVKNTYINKVSKNSLIEKYSSSKEREKYFKKKEHIFNNIVLLINQYPQINSIYNYNEYCYKNETKIKLKHNITLCTNSSSINLNEKDKNKIYDNFINLQEINKIVKNKNGSLNFYILENKNYEIYYNYNKANSDENNLYTNKVETKKIDEKWTSTFKTIYNN